MNTSSDERIHAYYEFHGVEDPEGVAEGLVVEQTIEFPPELVRDRWIIDEVVGRVEELTTSATGHSVHVSYPPEDVGGELPQLLSLLFGNCSLWPGVRLVDFELPESLLALFCGPRFGVAGVRELTGAREGPMLATAVKPLGSSPDELASMAYELAAGGIDIVKDDQGLANQCYAPFEKRVARVAAAIEAANRKFGRQAIYAPCVNGPIEELNRRIDLAIDAGAKALMVLPGVTGFDLLRHLAGREDVAVPLLAHPSMLGAFTASTYHGIAPGLTYGTIPRLSGADLTIYPHTGGRFSFPLEDCRSIAEACGRPFGTFRPTVPAPGGGITLDRVVEVARFYGPDVALLVGGDLQRGDLRENTRRLRALTGKA